MDWGTFLRNIRRFPDLHGIEIHFLYDDRIITESEALKYLVRFVAHLGEAWTGLGDLLVLYCDTMDKPAMDTRTSPQRNQVELETVLQEIRRMVRLQPYSVFHILLSLMTFCSFCYNAPSESRGDAI